ncbi:hypothetical protein AB0C33_02080 [Nonomuraea sp. NPDC048881]|uniref:hypothetical protein n=1 Tax=Nonomuraea sp. NPDC048881 TaxID=3155030 RepID=UPI00340E83B0
MYSVTTILDRGIPKHLSDWAAKQAAAFAVEHWEDLSSASEDMRFELISTAHQRARDVAADKGDIVHTSAENHLKGTPDGSSPKHIRQLEAFLKTAGLTPVHTEVTVWNRTIGYAGTADLIAIDKKSRHYLIDYKTGKGIWPEHAVQVEALARGEFIIHDDGGEEDMPFINEVGILHLRPQSWWFHPVVGDDAPQRNWSTFLGAKDIADWKRFHPSMVWGTTDRYNQANWEQYAA